jgi:hypothetical protein
MSTRIRNSISRLRAAAASPFLGLFPRQCLSLNDLATLHHSDKGHRWFSRHGYTDVYEQLFWPLKHEAITLLEIGLRHDPFYDHNSRISPSLSMWADYFQHARIIGYDINDFTAMTKGRVLVMQGDQGDDSDLQRLTQRVSSFDIIIDDGSHASWHQQFTLRSLFRFLRPGGLYIVEDLHARPAALEATLPESPPLDVLLKEPDFIRSLGIVAADVSLEKEGRIAIIRRSF